MANKERNLGQKPHGQQGMQDDRSDRESGQPLQLDDEKVNEKRGGQHAEGEKPHQDNKQHQGGGEHKGGQQHQGGNR